MKGAFGLSGQACTGTSRIIAVDAVHDELLERVVAKAEALRVGPGSEPGVDMGALASTAQLEKFLDYVRVGGRRAPRCAAGAPPSAIVASSSGPPCSATRGRRCALFVKKYSGRSSPSSGRVTRRGCRAGECDGVRAQCGHRHSRPRRRSVLRAQREERLGEDQPADERHGYECPVRRLQASSTQTFKEQAGGSMMEFYTLEKTVYLEPGPSSRDIRSAEWYSSASPDLGRCPRASPPVLRRRARVRGRPPDGKAYATATTAPISTACYRRQAPRRRHRLFLPWQRFRPGDGRPICPPATEPIQTYPVRRRTARSSSASSRATSPVVRGDGSGATDVDAAPTRRGVSVAARSAPATRRSAAGARVLADGGNAIDATLAMAAMAWLVLPGQCGIGGDAFAIVREPDGRVWTVTGAASAPMAATRVLPRPRPSTRCR